MPDESKKLQPYQEGDFIRDDRGKITAYCGPIFYIRYPSHCDLTQEIIDWTGLGYNIPSGIMNEDHGKVFQAIEVRGDIPEWFQARLRQYGCVVVLHKERGLQVEY